MEGALDGQCDEVTMIGDLLKLSIGRQERIAVLAACRCNQKLDRAGSDAF